MRRAWRRAGVSSEKFRTPRVQAGAAPVELLSGRR
jgi:hypothetical protein